MVAGLPRWMAFQPLDSGATTGRPCWRFVTPIGRIKRRQRNDREDAHLSAAEIQTGDLPHRGGVMNPQDIAARLVKIHTVMVDRFDAQPWFAPTLDVHQSSKVSVKLYGPDVTAPQNDHRFTATADTFEEALDAALAFVTALPPASESKRLDWQKQLGKLIDDGRAIGIETEFLNPLEASMKRLASNALTHEVTQ